jgi:hypothetical protein
MKSKNIKQVTLVGLALALAGCGGGGGGGGSVSNAPVVPPAITKSAEGVYVGSLSGSSNSAFQLLVLEDGSYWSMYGASTPSAFVVRGFVQGTGTSNNGSFASSNAKDFGFAPAVSGSLAATYTNDFAITGSLAFPSGSVGFSGAAPVATTYVYTNPALLSSIAGSWTLATLNAETLNVNISASGTISGTSSLGCSFTGTATPRTSGKNVFNLALTFGAAPCALAGQTASGIALNYPLATGKNQLIVAAVDSGRLIGTAAFGIR